ncbi:hypothetical protein RJ639_013770 [Escallonia herrerae]|uniref:UBA domain-containing protein n=1 Tax=Escallonia herrerae TaxID=1293975 RepID=A0AA88VJ50_9ASTE|nr:hypothetical protein RJ639_013770 [Escallonia herrerae]
MSPASKSKSKEKRAAKEPQKASSKPSGNANTGGGIPTSGYNPLLGTFHTLETVPMSLAPPLHVNGRFRNIDEPDEHNGSSFGTGIEYDSVSNNGSWSGDSEDHKEKMSHLLRNDAIPGAESEKREKIRLKNEKKHQRQKERRAHELHERCSGYLMSRKLEALAEQLVTMGFSSERAMMALISNEGRVEESVTWLFEKGEEADTHKEQNVYGGGNLKIDISEELVRVAEMETRFKCSKQEVERTVVSCEGDLEKAAETLKVQKQDPPSTPPKPEEIGDPPAANNGELSLAGSQNSLRAQQKIVSAPIIQQKRDENFFNYTKGPGTLGMSVESGSKNAEPLKKIQPKVEWAKPQHAAVQSEKRWPIVGSNPSVSYSFASPLQASPPSTMTEARYVAIGSELKNLQLGSVREPIVVMQRPHLISAKQIPGASVSSSPPGTGRYPNGLETSNVSGLTARLNNLSGTMFHNQHPYQQQQYVSGSSSVDSAGRSLGNGLWNRTGTSPTLAAASSLGLFSGLGSNGSSGSSSPVDWKAGGPVLPSDYSNIDWSLDRGPSSSRPNGMWQGMNSFMHNNTHIYDPYTTSGLNVKTSMRPILSNVHGVSMGGLQEGVASSETSAGGSREWASPFEERDLFSVPRQFVSSPPL